MECEGVADWDKARDNTSNKPPLTVRLYYGDTDGQKVRRMMH